MPLEPEQQSSAILILVGSLSAVSEQQCTMLRERAGVRELIVPPAVLRAGELHLEWAGWQARVGAHLGAHTDLLVRIGRDDRFDPAEGAQLSAALASLVAPFFAPLSGLIATGGETARAMLGTAGTSTACNCFRKSSRAWRWAARTATRASPSSPKPAPLAANTRCMAPTFICAARPNPNSLARPPSRRAKPTYIDGTL